MNFRSILAASIWITALSSLVFYGAIAIQFFVPSLATGWGWKSTVDFVLIVCFWTSAGVLSFMPLVTAFAAWRFFTRLQKNSN